MELRFNIGAGNTSMAGWENIDLGGDIYLQSQKDETVRSIYSSHFLEYFNYLDGRLMLVGWYNKLKKGGDLSLAVPDFGAISSIYQQKGIILNGPLYGKIHEPPIYHKCAYDYSILRHTLYEIGFRQINRVETLYWANANHLDDCSCAKVDGISISLNIECTK